MYNNKAEAQMKLEMLLRILEDMHPYPVEGIAALLKVSEDKAALFLRFLAKYRIVAYDESRKTAVICPDFLALK
jgi:Mn-dependent DtxR family transcriptional regulator